MISPAEMRVLDRNAQYFGVSILELMENAGKAVADVARSEFGAAGKNVLVLCGTGNNGGDGLVAARHLAKEARVTVLLARSPDQFVTQESGTNFERLRDTQIQGGPREEPPGERGPETTGAPGCEKRRATRVRMDASS